jgi:hypothetical protein
VQTAAHDSGFSAIVAILCSVAQNWLKTTVLLTGTLCVGGGWGLAQNAPSQSPQRLFGDLRDCPAGHRIEFVLPAATVYIDAHLVGPSTIAELQRQGGPACPTGPVKLTPIDLNRGILTALNLHHGLGTRLMRFGFGGDPTRMLNPGRVPSASEPQRSAPWIEDETLLKGVAGDIRGYLIYYPTPQGLPNRPVRIGCGGSGIFRLCSKLTVDGKDTPFDGVHYSYTLSQSDLAIPDVSPEYSTDPSNEPGALLEFDSRFRTWFLEAKQKP